jgi:hypothetical protein
MGKNSRSGIGDEPRAYKQFLVLKILKFFDADPDRRSGIRIFYPGSVFRGGKIGSGMFIPDPDPGSERFRIPEKHCEAPYQILPCMRSIYMS